MEECKEEKQRGEAVSDIITAEDMVDILRIGDGDYSFCCPLLGAYPCERHLRGCYCHELHLQNHYAALEGKP